MAARTGRGFLWGVLATVAMTIVESALDAAGGHLTFAGMLGAPRTIITMILGPGLPIPLHFLLELLLHLGYGGFWGAILFGLTPRVKVWHGIAMAAFLFLGEQIFLDPLLGRGVFASLAPNGKAIILIGMATHFTYGVTLGLLGWLADRRLAVQMPPESGASGIAAP